MRENEAGAQRNPFKELACLNFPVSQLVRAFALPSLASLEGNVRVGKK